MVKFWLRLLRYPEQARAAYEELFKLNIKSSWPFQSQNCLMKCGFSYVWKNGQAPKENESVFLRDLIPRLEDQNIQD